MKDRLGPAARLVDFLLGHTLGLGLKMHFQIQSTSVHSSQGRLERIAARRAVTAVRIEQMKALLDYAKEIE